jgi:hypothetical protein
MTGLFVITANAPIKNFKINNADDYEIQIPVSRRFAVVYDKTSGEISYIGITDAIETIHSNKHKPELSKAVTNADYLGYGMSYLTGKWDIEKIKEASWTVPFSILSFANSYRAADKPVTDHTCGIGSCTSGGAGSTSCSLTGPLNGCSVSCNSTSYACCNDNTVECYCCPNPKQ